MAVPRRAWQWGAQKLLGRSPVPPDPTDLRYPRSRVIRFLRWLALRPWLVCVGIYVAVVAPRMLTATLEGTLGKAISWTQVLLLDQVIVQVEQHLWIIAPLLGGLGVLGALGGWAASDRRHEQAVLMARKQQEDQQKAEQLLERSQTKLLRQMSEQFLLPSTDPELNPHHSPPFDEALLPAPDHFVGRTADLEWVLERLRTGRTTAITALGGMGGIGKTALAAVAVRLLRAEGRFQDGIAVVLCQKRKDAMSVLQDVLARFDPQRKVPETTSQVGLLETAQRLLAGKNALVVLDNVEPELAIEQVIQPLRSVGTTLLLTARQTLPSIIIPVEASYSLNLLATEEALEVLARALGHSSVDQLGPPERAGAEQIVIALERHTLAVKLAGAYVADLNRPLPSVAKELQDRRQALNLPAGETARAVEIMFSQSLETLPKEALRLFAALGAVATHECGRLAAVALAQAVGLVSPAEAVDLLVRRALIYAFTNTTLPEHSDRERLRFHPLLRALAESKFARWPEKQRQRAYRGVAHHYAAIVPRMKDEALEIDETNLIGALKWAQAHHQDALVSALCLGMMPYWYVRWRTAESLDYLPWGKAAAESVAQSTDDRADHLRAADLALTYRQVLRRTGRLEQAEQLLRENLARWRQLEDKRGEGEALLVLGRISRTRGQRAEAEAYYRQSLALFRLVRHQRGEGAALVFLGELMRDEKKLEEATRFTVETLDIHREVQNLQAEEAALTVLGRLALEAGRLEEAEQIFAQTLKIARQVRDRQGEGVNLFMLARLAQAQGEGAVAEGLYHESLAIFREVNSTFDLAEALLEIGAFLIAQRDKREEGCTMLREAIQLYASMRLPQEAVARQTIERLGCSS